MAEDQDKSQQTEEPTAKRLEQARKTATLLIAELKEDGAL
jgi:flagellar biosynthesis protein FlhB